MRRWKKIAGLTGAAVTASFLNNELKQRKKLHIDVKPPTMHIGDVNILPAIKTCFGLLPESVRHSIILAAAAPASGIIPRDRYEILGEEPYTVEEVSPNVWRVGYDRENHFMVNEDAKMQAKMLGLDIQQEETAWRVMQGAEGFGREYSACAHKDIREARYWNSVAKIKDEDIMNVAKITENMVVVKLNDGSVMLYAPVKIHDETKFGQFLKNLGTVEWIVAPSSEHTLQLPSIIKKFPNAKVIGSKNAEKKLNYVNALERKQVDYDYTDENELREVNKMLKKEGVQFFYICGDVVTHSLFSIAHNVALECDLLYSHHDGEGFLMVDKKQFRALKPEDWSWRIFKFSLLSKPNSPNGFLPAYRFWFMDPSCMWQFQLTPPAEDGSSCKEMADSLRTALNQDFETAVGVHFNTMKGSDFKKSIDANWNWLDGQSLLEKNV